MQKGLRLFFFPASEPQITEIMLIRGPVFKVALKGVVTHGGNMQGLSGL